MKNFTFTAFFATFCLAVSAQQVTVDFENLTLPTTESFYNGADEAGFFAIQNTRFENNYNTLYNSWSGYAYSNMTDVTTAGYMNQHSAFAGSGANSSAKYAIFYSSGIISFEGLLVNVDSLKVTNTTYAGISMRDGDAFTKQFGSPNGADNLPDGTDGKDFFKLWIYGLDSNDVKLDSISYYLADFRSNNTAEHYILNSWKNVSLTSLGAVYGLSFSLESSDNGAFGMNTPAYFALDNLSYSPSSLSVKNINQNEFTIYPNPVKETLNIQGGQGNLTVADITGKVVYTANHFEMSTVDFSKLNAGMYLVSIEKNGLISTHNIVK